MHKLLIHILHTRLH